MFIYKSWGLYHGAVQLWKDARDNHILNVRNRYVIEQANKCVRDIKITKKNSILDKTQ